MENNIEVVECIMQEKIASFIKKNRNMKPKDLAIEIEKMLDKKEEMYNMTEEEIKKELENKGLKDGE